jgi:hypothetical protein
MSAPIDSAAEGTVGCTVEADALGDALCSTAQYTNQASSSKATVSLVGARSQHGELLTLLPPLAAWPSCAATFAVLTFSLSSWQRRRLMLLFTTSNEFVASPHAQRRFSSDSDSSSSLSATAVAFTVRLRLVRFGVEKSRQAAHDTKKFKSPTT